MKKQLLRLILLASIASTIFSMEQTPLNIITVNYDPTQYSEYAILAPDYPDYPLDLFPGDNLGLANRQAMQTKSGKTFGQVDILKATFSSVHDYLARYYTSSVDDLKKIATYALGAKFTTYSYARYKLLKTGNAILQYSIPATSASPEIEEFYAAHLGTLLMELRKEYQDNLKNSFPTRLAYNLQHLRFSSWEWLANRWYSIRGR